MEKERSAENNDDKVKIILSCYGSEWCLGKFLPALSMPGIKEKFYLHTIAGREENERQVIERLQKTEQKKLEELQKANDVAKGYAARNSSSEIESIRTLLKQLKEGTISYVPLDTKRNRLPDEAYVGGKTLVYCSSSNPTHADYIVNALMHNAHVLVEKPTTTVLDHLGNATRDKLNQLEEIVKYFDGKLLRMDSEHYSYKQASEIFYKLLPKILGKAKIAQMSGELIEPDDPDKERNKKLFCLESETGLLTDTGVHLISFVSNLGAFADPRLAAYRSHSSYNVETGVDAVYKITNGPMDPANPNTQNLNGNPFVEGAELSIRLEKFSKHSLSRNMPEKSKKIELGLSDRRKIKIDLDKGMVIEVRPDGKTKNYELPGEKVGNEYSVILPQAYNCIMNPGIKPRTDLSFSLRTMESIYETYRKFPLNGQTYKK